MVKSCLVPNHFQVHVAKLHSIKNDLMWDPHLFVSTRGMKVPCNVTKEEADALIHACVLHSDKFISREIRVQATAVSGVQTRTSSVTFLCSGIFSRSLFLSLHRLNLFDKLSQYCDFRSWKVTEKKPEYPKCARDSVWCCRFYIIREFNIRHVSFELNFLSCSCL